MRGCSRSQLPTRLLGSCHFQNSPEQLAPGLKYLSSAYNGTFLLMLLKGRSLGGGPGSSGCTQPNQTRLSAEPQDNGWPVLFDDPVCLNDTCWWLIGPFAWRWYPILIWNEHGRQVELFHLSSGKHPLWDQGQFHQYYSWLSGLIFCGPQVLLNWQAMWTYGLMSVWLQHLQVPEALLEWAVHLVPGGSSLSSQNV